MNIFRWFSYKVKNTMTKWRLLDEQQIASIVDVHGNKTDCFYSIQNYNSDGENKACPIFVDLDRGDAWRDAMDLARNFRDMLGVFPDMYISGSKGYHLIIPINIVHPKCEKIAKYIVSACDPGESWDTEAYKSRQMWRIPNTINTKSGKIKTRTCKQFKFDYDNLNKEFLKQLIEEAKQQIRQEDAHRNECAIVPAEGDWRHQLTPCIETLLVSEPSLGTRHAVRVLLARFFRKCGVPIDEAIAIIANNPFYESRKEKLHTVFNSIYSSNQPASFGCKNEKILQDRCCEWLCVYK